MAKGKFPKADKVREYLEQYPTAASLTLARKVYADFPLLFSGIEDARSVVRALRGKHGVRARKNIQNVYDHTTVDPNKLPKSFAKSWQPYVMPAKCDNILVISDIHIPYHDNDAITAALNFGLSQKVNGIIILGDLLDFHKVSRFEKDPHARSVAEEFEAGRLFLKYLRSMFPEAHIIYAEGNHDARYPRFLAAHALELFDDQEIHLPRRLKLDEVNIEFIEETRIIKAGKLSLSHGHKIVNGVFAPVNAARGVSLRTKESHVIGHTHQVSEHTENYLSGGIFTTWSVGCLCDLRPAYNPFVNKNAHGFGHLEIEQGGHYRFKNYRILNGEIL